MENYKKTTNYIFTDLTIKMWDTLNYKQRIDFINTPICERDHFLKIHFLVYNLKKHMRNILINNL